MRGDIDAAEKLCLSILKRYPNEPEAHVLLGELCQDRGDWQRAVEWFELAVDLNPNSPADQAKLDEARKHIEETETAETVEQLGLPEHNSKSHLATALVAGIVILAAIAAFATNKMQNRSGPPPVNSEVVAPTPDADTDGAAKDANNTDNSTQTPKPDHTTPLEDRTLLALLQKRSEEGDKVTGIVKDPRYQTVTISYDVPSDGDPRKIGATLAKDALDQDPDALVVTVQGSSNSQVVYTADATRLKLQEIEASNSGSDDKSDPDAWIAKLLQNEWTPQSGPKDKPKDKDSTTPSSTDDTTPATTSGNDAPPPGADASNSTSSTTSTTPASTPTTKSGG
jgi:hypothetical protein